MLDSLSSYARLGYMSSMQYMSQMRYYSDVRNSPKALPGFFRLSRFRS